MCISCTAVCGAYTVTRHKEQANKGNNKHSYAAMKNIMKHSPVIRKIGTVAACALALAALSGAAQSVLLPLKIQGVATATVNLADLTWQWEDRGLATYLGRFTNLGSGIDFHQAGDAGSGAVTAVNGDQIFWVSHGTHVEFTGGTGRFVNVSGEFSFVETILDVSFPSPGTLVVTLAYTGIGSINFGAGATSQ